MRIKKTSRQFGILLGVVSLLVGLLIGSGWLELGEASSGESNRSFGLPFWMGASALAFIFSFGMHLWLVSKKDSMEAKGEVSEDERMFEPFYGTEIKEKLGVVVSVILLGSLPVVIVALALKELQPVWLSIMTAISGLLVLLIITVYVVILFKNSREFYDRYETYIVPLMIYALSMVIYKYSLSLQNIPPPASVSWYAIAAVIYTVAAIPVGVKLLLSANRTIYDKKARAEDELEFASEVQQQFLQDQSVKAENICGFGRSVAARQVGGDFFYLEQQKDQSVVAAVGDVSGHSFGAGLIMSMLVTTTQDHMWYNGTPDGLFERLNNRLRAQEKRTLFATMSMVHVLDDKVKLWNAGHMPVLKYSKTEGKLFQLKANGVAMGMTGHTTYTPDEVPLAPGDVLILYSDGLVETRGEDGQIRDLDHFETIVEDLVRGDNDPDELAQMILEDVLKGDMSDYPEDDLTILVLQKS